MAKHDFPAEFSGTKVRAFEKACGAACGMTFSQSSPRQISPMTIERGAAALANVVFGGSNNGSAPSPN